MIQTYAEKLAAAIAFLGERYVFHLARRIPKGDYEPPIMRANVQETFARVQKRLGNGKKLVLA